MEQTCLRCNTPSPDGARFCSTCGSPATPVSPEAPGAPRGADPILPDRLKVIRSLGRGGMGCVYLCRDEVLDVEVAVKVLPPEVAHDTDALARLEKEARAAAKFRNHSSILTLHGFHRYGDTHFLEMEFAAGGSLYDRLKREGPLPEAECRRLGAELADALGYAHKRDVLHRDIKPANVLLDEEGRVKVADFGIAKVLSDTSARLSAWTAIGTLDYMPPEQYTGGRMDGRADLYALGVMLYEMATGERPFRGQEGLAQRLLPGATAPDPRERTPALSKDYAGVVQRLLQPDPEDRFADAAAVAAALRAAPAPKEVPGAARGGTVPAYAAHETIPVGKPRAAPGSRAGRWAAALVGLVAVAAVAVFAWPEAAKDPPSRGREEERVTAPPKGPPEGGTGPEEDGSGKSHDAGDAGAGVDGGDEEGRDPGAGEPEAAGPDPAPGPEPPAAPEPGVFVFSDPPGARVTLDGAERGVAGVGGLRLDRVPTGTTVTLKAWLDDYRPAEKEVNWDGTSREDVRLVLERLTGFLILDGGLPGASVEAVRRDAEPVTASLAEDGTLGPMPVAVGEYEVTVSLAGHDPWSGNLTVAAGRTARATIDLRERDGTVAADTDPPGAVVFDGESRLGTTPLPPTALRAGRHALRFTHPDRDDLEREVTVRGDVSLDLGTLALPELAVLDLTTLPPGVTATLDGKPVSGTLRRKSGTVSLVLSRADHRPQTVAVDLRSGETRSPVVAPFDPNPGVLDLTALPADCEVRVDGEPARGRHEVAAGRHEVTLARKGYRPVPGRTVTVPPGGTVPIEAPEWVALVTVTPAVPGLPPPPDPVLAAQRRLDPLPAGVVRDEAGRLWAEIDGMELVLVPEGEFTMGSNDGDDDEKPVHRVFVSAVLMDRHEVTNEQFARFVEATGHRTDAEKAGKAYALIDGKWGEFDGVDWRHPEGPGSSIAGRGTHPAVAISWTDAAAYARWAGRRLPTEAEWEKAARGADGRTYPWGSTDDEKRRNGPGSGHGFAGNAPAGSFPDGESPFGALDMSGNVWEWCSDWFDSGWYAKSPARDPQGPSSGSSRVLRGGSWLTPPRFLRAADRGRDWPSYRHSGVGFRCARGLP